MRLSEAATAVCDLIRDVGVAATADARDLDLPAALVTPENIECDRLGNDEYTVTWAVYLLAPDNGALECLDDLGDMFDQVKDALGVSEAKPMTLSLPNIAADPLPVLMLTVTTEVTKE